MANFADGKRRRHDSYANEAEAERWFAGKPEAAENVTILATATANLCRAEAPLTRTLTPLTRGVTIQQ